MVIGFAGFSGSGKTTLIEKLIPIFKGRGLKVAVIKHDAHDFEMDHEGKDTWRFYTAGADIVMISSAIKSARVSNSKSTLDEMISQSEDADLILVEGFKTAGIKKMAVTGKQTGYDISDNVQGYDAIVTDDIYYYQGSLNIPVFDRNDLKGISEWIMNKYMDKADRNGELTHFDEGGNARMVNVSDKDITLRTAKAGARVLLNRETFALIKDGGVKKGDVLTVAQIAGIMGAKKTPELIPMCHPVIIDGVDVKLKLSEADTAIDIEASVKCTGRTGVEMEAICACSIAAMTVYDMCKSVQRDIVLTDIRLISKSGGVHGDYERQV